jgi:hypothetical protein
MSWLANDNDGKNDISLPINIKGNDNVISGSLLLRQREDIKLPNERVS